MVPHRSDSVYLVLGKSQYMRRLDPNQPIEPLFKAKVIVSALYKRKGRERIMTSRLLGKGRSRKRI